MTVNIKQCILRDRVKYTFMLRIFKEVICDWRVIYVKKKYSELAACAVMAALLCVLSPFSIPVGPIPVNPAIFVVCLASYILGAEGAFLSVLVYLLLGLAGLPVFSGFSGGLGKLAGPTGGYLIGYLFTAFIAGWAAEKSGRRIVISFFGMIVAVAAAYFFGTVWFVISANAELGYALSVCVLPFIPFDIAKTAAALLLGRAIRGALSRAGLI